MRIMIAAAALLAMLLSGFAVQARQDDPRLDGLFKELQTTKDEAKAADAERQIWSIWTEAGSADLDVLMRQGTAAMAVHDYKLALESFNALIALAPDFAEAWNKRATVYYMMQNYDAAVADVKHTLALEPRHFGAIVGMGLIYDQLGDEKAALRAFERGLKINPHMDQIREKTKKIEQELRDRNI